MKFTQLLKNLIVEQSRFEILFDALTKPSVDKEGKKQKPKLTDKEFYEIVKADPTTRLNNIDLETATKEDFQKVKAGSYVKWLIKRYLSPTTEIQPGQKGYEKDLLRAKEVFLEDLYKVTNDLKKFERFKTRLPEEKRNIDNIKSTSELYDLVKDFSLEKTKASKEEKKTAAETYEHPGGKIVFRGNKWTVAKISDQGKLGKDAACFYGGNYLEPSKGETRWCTSSPGLNWFDRYIKDGPLYVVIPNNWQGKRGESSGLPAERYQFHFQSNQFMDVHDNSIDLIEFLNGEGAELKQFFKPEFAQNLTTGEMQQKKLTIDSFTSGAVGKYIALYGVEDIFENLPLDMTDIQLNNRDDNGIIINIPASIGKYKKLKQLLLTNCVDRIPDEVCELKDLRFIGLVDNPKLTQVPSCIVNLDKLIFLNLKGSKNVVVPDEIKQRATLFGDEMWDFGTN
jgi:hypothetical protein